MDESYEGTVHTTEPLGLEWFRHFVEFGVRLDEVKSEAASIKALLIVPTNDFVSTAIAVGMSKAAFLAGSSETIAIDGSELVTLDPGTRVLIRHPAGSRVVEFISLSEDGRKLQATGARIDISRAISFELVDDTTPLGDYIDKEFDGLRSMGESSKPGWENQQRPTLTIFGSRVQIEAALEEKTSDRDLRKLTGQDQVTLWEASRLDWLYSDSYAHSINAFCQTDMFPNPGEPEFAFVERCKWILLDGNSAISRTVTREQLRKKNVLSVLNLGNHREQSQAISQFLSEANYGSEMQLPELKTSLPEGCYLSCWAVDNV